MLKQIYFQLPAEAAVWRQHVWADSENVVEILTNFAINMSLNQ